MRVLMLPDYTLQNPYQWLLARALHDRGVEVTFSDGIGRLPVSGSVRAYGRPDVVHLHWPDNFIRRGTAARTLAAGVRLAADLAHLRLRGVRIVWTVHNAGSHDSSFPRAERVAHRLIARVAHAVTAHTSMGAGVVANHLGARRRNGQGVHVVPHGHYRDAYPRTITREAARASLELRDDERVLLAFGQLRRYRGIEDLLAALDSLPALDVRLLIAGPAADPELKDAVESAALRDPRIRAYLGFCPPDEVQRYFTAADVVVLPYRDVLSSGVAALAATFGRACVVPERGELPHVLPGAIRYDPTARDGLSDALLRAAVEPEPDALGARNAASTLLADWEMVADRTLRAYGASGPETQQTDSSNIYPGPWRQRVALAQRDIVAAVPMHASLTLLDDGTLFGDIANVRDVTAFPGCAGVPWGSPVDDDEAVACLDKLLAGDARWLVVPWTSFWWFDVYPQFARRLFKGARCSLRTDRVAVFELPGRRRAA